MQKYHEDIKEYAGSLGIRAGFVNRDSRCYLVRNLVDSCYKEQAVLVLHLNEEYCFESLINYPACAGANLRVNGEKLSVKENEALDQWQEARGEKSRTAMRGSGTRFTLQTGSREAAIGLIQRWCWEIL